MGTGYCNGVCEVLDDVSEKFCAVIGYLSHSPCLHELLVVFPDGCSIDDDILVCDVFFMMAEKDFGSFFSQSFHVLGFLEIGT